MSHVKSNFSNQNFHHWQIGHFGHFYELVNVARFARNFEWAFCCNFKTVRKDEKSLPLDRALLLLESERDLFRYPCSACPTDMAEEEEVESMPVTEPAWSVMEDSATDPESLRCRDLLLEAWLELLSKDSPIRRVDCSEYSELSTSVNRSRWPLQIHKMYSILFWIHFHNV